MGCGMNRNEIGTMSWFRECGGNLTVKSKLSLLSKVLVPSMSGFLKTSARLGKKKNIALEKIPFPDSAAVKMHWKRLKAVHLPVSFNIRFEPTFGERVWVMPIT